MGVYFRAKKAQLEMLRDRGFSLSAAPFLANLWQQNQVHMLSTAGQPIPADMQPTQEDLLQLAPYYSISVIDETPLLNLNRTDMTNLYTANGQTQFLPASLNQLYFKINEAGEVEACLVYYDNSQEGKAFGVEAVGPFLAYLDRVRQQISSWLKEVIIVINNSKLTTSDAGSSSRLQKVTYCNITIFQADEIAINPKKHIFAPEIYKLNQEEKMEHLAGKARSQLPTYRYSDFKSAKAFHDPLVKYYGYQVTDLIRIEREVFYAPTIIHREVSYRVVQQF